MVGDPGGEKRPAFASEERHSRRALRSVA